MWTYNWPGRQRAGVEMSDDPVSSVTVADGSSVASQLRGGEFNSSRRFPPDTSAVFHIPIVSVEQEVENK